MTCWGGDLLAPSGVQVPRTHAGSSVGERRGSGGGDLGDRCGGVDGCRPVQWQRRRFEVSWR